LNLVALSSPAAAWENKIITLNFIHQVYHAHEAQDSTIIQIGRGVELVTLKATRISILAIRNVLKEYLVKMDIKEK
jgi:hypothetical protein